GPPHVLVARDAELQPASPRERPEVAHECDDHLLILDGVDESVGELLLDPEHPVQAGVPGAALDAVPAGGVRDVDDGAVAREALQGPPSRGGELLGGRDQVEAGAGGEAVVLAHRPDGDVGLPGGPVRLAEGVAEEGGGLGGGGGGGAQGGKSAASSSSAKARTSARWGLGTPAASVSPKCISKGWWREGDLAARWAACAVLP